MNISQLQPSAIFLSWIAAAALLIYLSFLVVAYGCGSVGYGIALGRSLMFGIGTFCSGTPIILSLLQANN